MDLVGRDEGLTDFFSSPVFIHINRKRKGQIWSIRRHDEVSEVKRYQVKLRSNGARSNRLYEEKSLHEMFVRGTKIYFLSERLSNQKSVLR